MIGEEPLDAHQGSRRDLHEAFADRLPQKREPKPEVEQSEQGYRQPGLEIESQSQTPAPNRRPPHCTQCCLDPVSSSASLWTLATRSRDGPQRDVYENADTKGKG